MIVEKSQQKQLQKQLAPQPPQAPVSPPAVAPPAAVPSTQELAASLQPVWTAGMQQRITPWQTSADYAVERLSWRGPRSWCVAPPPPGPRKRTALCAIQRA